MANADKKSNPGQIVQAVLDEANQAIKVNVVAGGGDASTDVDLTKVGGNSVAVNTGAADSGTQRVVLASNQTTIPVDIQDTSIAVDIDKDTDSITIYAPNNNTTAIPVSGSVSVSNQPSALSVVGSGAATTALRVQLANESLTALENINVTVTNSEVEIKNDIGNPVPVSAASLPLPAGAATESTLSGLNTKVTTTANGIKVDGSAVTQPVSGSVSVSNFSAISGLSIPAHDYISLSYTGGNLTGVVYRTGGSGGTIVGTLTLAYSGSDLISVTKS